jgi:hypothetical protein
MKLALGPIIADVTNATNTSESVGFETINNIVVIMTKHSRVVKKKSKKLVFLVKAL